ncbi:MAG: type I-U CRISPR-associated helicase/endonuclease Cas3 [Myxococcota bacterium]
MTPPELMLERALGNPPFPWQRRLLRTLIEGSLPDALDIPTGLGKTATIAIWLVARACGASHLPRRLVYIVDRRAVVDQATTEAERLRAWVATDRSVREALGLENDLPVSTLRGAFVDNRAWLVDPSAPAIVVGTVDMVGSRLLFEGYGASRRMRPYFAGALGHDTLFVLDEAHLVPPFEHLLRQVTTWPRTADAGVLPPPRLLPLSATGRSYEDPFRLDGDDLAHPEVSKRIHAPKRVTIETLTASLPDTLAERAWETAESAGSPRRVLVFVTKRIDAQAAATALEKRIAKERPAGSRPTVVLFVGGRRVHERTSAFDELASVGFLAGSSPPSDHAFLVATSAGEVGVDLDADDMVSDVVAWERMVQRLGRVNRRGRGGLRATRVRAAQERGPRSSGRPLPGPPRETARSRR